MAEETKVLTVTAEGLKKLQDELAYLVNVKRPEVTKNIGIARGCGDLSENSEYDEAKNEQAKVESAIASTWRGTIVSPYLMVQCSDSRHWSTISDRVYRFSAMDLTSEERKTIHGHNEKIRLDCLYHATEFYIRLVKSL